LIYSVWFDDNAQVTIDIDDNVTIGDTEYKGLFSQDIGTTNNLYKFYGTADAKIVVKAGNVLHKALLTNTNEDNMKFVTIASDSIEITGNSSETAVHYPDGEESTAKITGYLNWTIPEDAQIVTPFSP
jgi:hypothetical protein